MDEASIAIVVEIERMGGNAIAERCRRCRTFRSRPQNIGPAGAAFSSATCRARDETGEAVPAMATPIVSVTQVRATALTLSGISDVRTLLAHSASNAEALREAFIATIIPARTGNETGPERCYSGRSPLGAPSHWSDRRSTSPLALASRMMEFTFSRRRVSPFATPT